MATVRFGRYEVVRHLASGGMAEVYLARTMGDGGFSRYLVIKAMRPSAGLDGTFARMFLDEARLAATLHHQHIAQVYDLGHNEDGAYYLAMEYVHGETLRNLVAAARQRALALPPGFGVAVGAAVASALQYAHERCDERGRPLNIVHRDVTPANILVGHDGAVKLIDFGIAKAAARTSQTQTGVVKGKAGYMAPEQVLNQPLDARTDVFALGIVLYELTTQERLFAGSSDFESAQRCVDAEVPRPSKLRPGFPPALESVLLTALARQADARFPSARAMGQALVDAAARDGLDAHPSIVERVVGKMFGARPEPWQRLPVARADTDVDRGEDDDDDEDLDGTTERLPNIPDVDEEPLPAVGWMAALPVRPVPLSATASAGSPASMAAAAEPTLVVPVVMPVLSLPLPAPAAPPEEPAQVATGSNAGPVSAPAPPPGHDAASWTDDSEPEAFELPPRPGSVPRRAVTHPPISMGSRRAVLQWVGVAALFGIAIGVATSIAAGGDEPVVASSAVDAEPEDVVAVAPPPPVVTPPPPVVTPPPAPVPAPPPPPPPASQPALRPSGLIRVIITTNPPDATVVIDGRRLGRTPFDGIIKPRGDQIWLKVRKRGYKPRKTKVPVRAELTWDVRLPSKR